ncbi:MULTISPECIES: thiolase family protein [Chryseobacterium]|jgi:acetyl-CoA acyltransferase|uniref:acetyl-CoA C-acyltransferase n=2 Tax=Chryseobacterium rhizosphaerae TaxID=395937 RepID=A0AAE3Y7M2_9FLAO|nr:MULTISPECIES: acetyl-CoA C-acyltransferase [Chryseobacterium]MBL3549221.1 acetyl-CoA C-acyltransferase [Chryseobacterium sp. KMC2]MDC8100485.1 acetyl-CoA C-acyltransferase [Chryseobacterium rhizosphaerae]MDR6525382.1 acetyl-CoA acyltransferase [Chryseobacterium rhizosphaerae]REC74582.1 acetyl-CoA C-acyltransferase [Chryseobacterium rhizosphaerae]SMC38781.1 acetyl-CoA acyltransferase [Chryseobacterium sp. YR221]
MKQAYIVKGFRSAVGKAPKGSLRFTRPDVMAATVIEKLMAELPQLDKNRIDDLIVGNAMPEAEQGLNVARLISLMGLNTDKVPGVTVNRYCASGSEAIAIASAKIQAGMADCIIAGGTESMSYIPMGGYKPVPETDIAKTNPDYYWGMGYTAEEVAKQYNITREEQDQFAFESHVKALKANQEGKFVNQIVPIPVEYNFLDENQKMQTKKFDFSVDEGPRKDTSFEGLSKLRPVFANGGSVTAGNSSQMSDGAAFVMVMSEEMVKELGLEPEARLVAYAAAGLEPRIMGMGPIYAIPKALKQAGLELKDIDLIELNEAFASQSVAIKKELGLNPDILNVNGGAIALGHPLGCTGTKLTVQLLDEMRKRGNKYGMVSMCVGTGQGAASIFELL